MTMTTTMPIASRRAFVGLGGRSRPFSIGERRYAARIGGRSRAWKGD
jgi:hypothetical protein